MLVLNIPGSKENTAVKTFFPGVNHNWRGFYYKALIAFSFLSKCKHVNVVRKKRKV